MSASALADAGAVDPQIWPDTLTRGSDGMLRLGAITLAELTARFGSPLMLIDEQTVRTRAARIRHAFSAAFAEIGTSCAVYYAGKALLTTRIASWMVAEGLGIDACSLGELTIAAAAGVAPARMALHGNNKSDAELHDAVERGVGSVVVDSVEEIDRLARVARRHGRIQGVRLRVNSGVHADTHDFLATAHDDQKFGIPRGAAADAVRLIRSHPSLRFLGLHTHIGSQVFDLAGYRESARRMLTLHAQLLQDGPVPELNLGGGFGVAYTQSDQPPAIEHTARTLAMEVGAICEHLAIPVPKISVEPGRWIIALAGLTVYTVGTIKDVPLVGSDSAISSRRYISVDGGMSDNLRPALYGARYSAVVDGHRPEDSEQPTRVVGKHCEAGDVLIPDIRLPADVERGELLVLAGTGAYCAPLASNYNSTGRPPLIAVSDTGAKVLLAGESLDDVLRRDPGIAE